MPGYDSSMRLAEYESWDACEMAERVARGDVSPAELTEAAIERIEARNPDLNAVVTPLFERARASVDALPDGPFKGVPFLLKDLKQMLAGTPTTSSCKLLFDHTPTVTSTLTQRYEAAGLVILGKTNTPEFGIMGITEPELRGPCRNPWNTDHTPGGSSGGSASAVAARMVPVAHGGDGGGSIRIPASCCGLFGLKPSRGRVTMAPSLGDAWDGFVQEHCLAVSVRDSAAFLDIADLPTPGEPYAAPHKLRPWREEIGCHPGKLRIGFTRGTLFAGESSPEAIAAVDDAIALLRELGHEVVESTPSFPREELVHAYFIVVAAYTAWFVEDAARIASRKPHPDDFEAPTWLLAQIGWKTRAPDLVNARITIQRGAREVGAWFEDFDCFLSSTMARPPVQIGEIGLSSADRRQLALLRAVNVKKLLDLALNELGTNALAATPNTQLFNQTGQPAMSVPLYWTEGGLPIGVQIAGRMGGEATLFRLASQLEEARPWAGKRPPILGVTA